jgi:hypothetical protein
MPQAAGHRRRTDEAGKWIWVRGLAQAHSCRAGVE